LRDADGRAVSLVKVPLCQTAGWQTGAGPKKNKDSRGAFFIGIGSEPDNS